MAEILSGWAVGGRVGVSYTTLKRIIHTSVKIIGLFSTVRGASIISPNCFMYENGIVLVYVVDMVTYKGMVIIITDTKNNCKLTQ